MALFKEPLLTLLSKQVAEVKSALGPFDPRKPLDQVMARDASFRSNLLQRFRGSLREYQSVFAL